ncbi:MAG: M16 family metallopeptidase [Sandaracinaceae bacterium]
MIRTTVLLSSALAALSIVSSAARAQDAHAVFGAEPRVERLSNGLTVISVHTESPGIVAYYTLVRVGSRDEVEPGHSGFAHLFEHMMFRGTDAVPAARYEELLQSFGADNNAYTSQDFTLYTVTTPSASLPQVIELEADRFQHLSYTEEVFRTETGAVHGEYDTQRSSPMLPMWEALSEIAFSRHTYGHTTLGYLRDIEAMPERYDYSRRFFTRFYTPDDCTIIAAGDVDHAALMAAVRERYGSWRGRRDRPRVPVEPEPTAGARRHIAWQAPAQPRMFVGWRVPGFVSGRSARERRAALRTTAALQVVHGLAFSEPSPLYQHMVVDQHRALELGSWSNELSLDPSLFVAHVVLADNETFDPAIAEIQGAIDELASGVDAERLDAVKSHARYALLMELQTPSDVADLIARFVAVGSSLDVLYEYLEELRAVTVEDVSRVARELLNDRRRFVVTLSRGADPSADGPPTPSAEDPS